jgi:ribose/xylose/arabinose/galactoside ABC-type transport system permease subunit
MTKNMGGLDRIVRAIAGIALILYALGIVASGTGYNVWGWIGVVPLLTALIGWCPAYLPFGIKTCKTQ